MDSKLKLYNSLTRKKELFVPEEWNKVKWYSCGPTVYDEAHMGHARTYVTSDILRRVLMYYFEYNVIYVMNITDVDDKIITKARQVYLRNNYFVKTKSIQTILDDIDQAILLMKSNIEKETNKDKKVIMTDIVDKASSKLIECRNNSSDPFCISLKFSYDILSEWLDQNNELEIEDPDIFSSLPKLYEKKFFDDMSNLKVRIPDLIPHVRDSIPYIISYIKKIICNNFAYESNGSVYFDTVKFSEKYSYAKLVPEAYNCCKEITETDEKRNINDFVLWKAAKPREPFWNSPWGNGRPGWHIECSTMARGVLGDTLTIHSGGADLKFPHHDNEIAQTEAYHDKENSWVKFFLHIGHLTINGCKMSKSLKNFVTIKEALTIYSNKQIRLMFLLHSWSDTINYSSDTMKPAIAIEKTFDEFFLTVEDIKRKAYNASDKEIEEELNNKVKDFQDQIHIALCDSIDTRTVLELLRKIISNSHSYINIQYNNNLTPNYNTLEPIVSYVTRILQIFGVIEKHQSKEEIDPCIIAFANFRETVRQIALKQKNVEILNLCDTVRDNVFPTFGVRVEDSGETTIIKLIKKK